MQTNKFKQLCLLWRLHQGFLLEVAAVSRDYHIGNAISGAWETHELLSPLSILN